MLRVEATSGPTLELSAQNSQATLRHEEPNPISCRIDARLSRLVGFPEERAVLESKQSHYIYTQLVMLGIPFSWMASNMLSSYPGACMVAVDD